MAVISTVRRVDGPPAGHVAAGPVDGHRAALRRRCRRARRSRSAADLARGGSPRCPRLRARARRADGPGTPSSAARSSSRGTRRSSSTTPSKRSVSSRTAASPRARTSARIARTAATGSRHRRWSGRGSRAARSPVTPRRSSRVSMAAHSVLVASPRPERRFGAEFRETEHVPADASADRAELSALTTAVDELTKRITLIIERYCRRRRATTCSRRSNDAERALVASVSEARRRDPRRSSAERPVEQTWPEMRRRPPKGPSRAATPGGGSRYRHEPGGGNLVETLTLLGLPRSRNPSPWTRAVTRPVSVLLSGTL